MHLTGTHGLIKVSPHAHILDPEWGKGYHAPECQCSECLDGQRRRNESKMYPDDMNKKRGREAYRL